MRGPLCVTALLGVLAAPLSAQEYKVVKQAKLGGEGGWDYLSVDAAARRLYVSRSSHVMVLDADTTAVVGDIPDTPGVHGIAIATDLGRGFTSNGKAGTATIFDLASLKPVGSVKTGENPDAILYDAFTHRVFTFNGRSHDATVFDAKTGAVLATIPLGGKPEFSVTDLKGTVFANVEDTGEIVALDASAMKVKARFPLKPCEEPSGLAFDAEHRRLFAVCGNALMAVVDADTGKLVTTLPIGKGTDGAGFDAAAGMAFASNGEGTLTVVREISPERFEVAQTLKTQRSARTMTIDPKTHRIYLPAAEYGPPPAATPEQPRPRPVALPGTFEIMVVATDHS